MWCPDNPRLCRAVGGMSVTLGGTVFLYNADHGLKLRSPSGR